MPYIPELVDIIVHNTNSTCGDLYIYTGDNYQSVYSSPNSKIFTPTSKPILNIEIDEKECRIPIIKNKVILGLFILHGRPGGYEEDIVTPYIDIVYLALYEDNKYKEMFLANMSHEIRTPLNGILGYTQLLSKTETSETQKKYISSMFQCSFQLLQLINDILDYSKLSSGKVSITTECFRLTELTCSVMDSMSQRIEEKNQTCDFIIDPLLPELIVADKNKLIQILINLISNANKFTPRGGKIIINITQADIEKLYITVSDTGIGIPKEEYSKIFEAFERVGCNKNGTGLGLAITKKLVTLLGGDIVVNSTLGEGTSFSFHINYTCQTEINEIDIDSMSGICTLVVGVEKDVVNILKEWGLNVISCKTTLEAFKYFLNPKTHLDFGIINTSECGIELTKQIKTDRPAFPILGVGNEYINHDFDLNIQSPVAKIQLFNCILHILSKNNIRESYLGHKSPTVDTMVPFSYFNKDMKILIAEDIIYNSNLLVSMLSLIGYNDVDIANNGKQCIDMIIDTHNKSKPYEVLLLDIRMPEMNGYEVINEYNKRGWKLPHIVVVTASTVSNEKERCRQVGVEYFINKPIDLQHLRDVMLRVSERLPLIQST
jgi:CheY-like chemotaxis protein